MTPTFRTITLTRRSDNKTLTLPVVMGTTSADIGGERMLVDVPYLPDDAWERAMDFVGANVEQQLQYLYVDGDGITSAEFDDYAYALA